MKSIINIISKFIFMIILLIFTILSILNGTLCSKEYIFRKIEKNNYVLKLTKDIREEVENYTIQSGFSKDLFDSVFTEEEVEKDLKYVINTYYNKKKLKLDYTYLKEKMNDKINNYLKENNSKADQKDLDKFNDMISNVYKTKLTVGDNLKYLSKLGTIHRISIILLPILFIGMSIYVFIKVKHNELDYFISPIIATSFMLICIILYIKNNIDIKNILVFGSNFSIVLRSIIYGILRYLTVISIVGLIISILALIIINIKNDKIK